MGFFCVLLGSEEDNMEESVGSLELRKEQINPELNPAIVYLNRLRPGSSKESMFRGLKRACKLLGLPDKPDRIKWENLRAQHLEEIKCKLIEWNQSQATFNATIQALRGVAKTAHRLGLITREDCDQIFKLKTSWPGGPRGLVITPEDVLEMDESDLDFDESDLHIEESKNLFIQSRNEAIFKLIAFVWLQPSEVVSLNLEDYISDKDGGIIHIRGHGARDRQFDLNERIDKSLKNWFRCRGYAPGALFLGRRGKRLTRQWVYYIIRRRGERHNIRCSPRALKKNLTSTLLEGELVFGENFTDEVQKMAGHAQRQTTARYREERKRVEKNRRKPGGGRKARY